MTFDELLAQVLALLQRQGRVSYWALKRRFGLDDADLEGLKDELMTAQRLAMDEDGKVLVWSGALASDSPPAATPAPAPAPTPRAFTPPHLTEKILATRAALEGEREQVTVLFADIKDSTELIKALDPEVAQQLLVPAIHRMMDAVHRFEGTVNQVLGDGVMALFGAPIAHEDHTLRACYAALAMQAALRDYVEEVRRRHGLALRIWPSSVASSASLTSYAAGSTPSSSPMAWPGNCSMSWAPCAVPVPHSSAPRRPSTAPVCSRPGQ
jgi:Adenylate and Guanylate cyclase catalytic domain